MNSTTVRYTLKSNEALLSKYLKNPENNRYTMNSTKVSRPFMDSIIEDGFIVLFRILD